MAIRNDGNWEGWIKFFLRGVVEVSEDATKTARQILDLREKGRIQIASQPGSTVDGQRLLDFLFEHPLVSMKMVSDHFGCHYVTANKLVGQFEKMGLLEETTGWRRNRRYRFKPYLDLFRSEPIDAKEDEPPNEETLPPNEDGKH